jgi:hypothetical protein
MIQNAIIRSDADETTPIAGAHSSERGWRLEVLQQLLAELVTVTLAGRHFTMEKILKLLQEQIPAAEPALSRFQRRTISTTLEELRREQGRFMPDADAFVVRAELIVNTLALA